MESNDILDIIVRKNINGFDSPGGTDKASCHSYDIIYSKLLSKYRETSGSILEIGIQYGGSALIWQELLPLFRLVLIDIANQVHPSIWDRLLVNRYNYIETNAYTEETITLLKLKYPDGFDIIIDDGPHDIEAQIFTMQKYSKLLKKGGTLIIEDVQDFEHVAPIMSSINSSEYTSLKFYDLRSVKDRYDDLIIVLTK